MLLKKLFISANPFILHTPLEYLTAAIVPVILAITSVLAAIVIYKTIKE